MAKTTDTVALNDWHAIGCQTDASVDKPLETKLLGQRIRAQRDHDGALTVIEINDDSTAGRTLRVQENYGHIWACLGTPARELFDMPEYNEAGRRQVLCGTVRVKASPLRIVENFLDLGHFPYVHPGVLGQEPQTQVYPYQATIREDVDEVWATDCRFYQQQAAMSASDGQETQYMYRVPAPYVTMLYKTCPQQVDAWDVIGLFAQPLEEDLCDVHTFMWLIDETSTMAQLIQFQQMIFLQDRNILENQMPKCMPLNPRAEAGVQADIMSATYRRWLRKKNLQYGAIAHR